MDTFASTTVLLVRRDGQVCMASDGQVTMNNSTIVKSSAKKVRRAGKGKVLVGFAGGGADALALYARLRTKAVQVGLLITLITCAIYVIAWEIAYFNFFPNFLDQYSAHVIAKMRSTGESDAAILETSKKLADLAKNYTNPIFNSAVTFMEVFPVGLIMTLVSAAILRRKPRQDAPASAVPA